MQRDNYEPVAGLRAAILDARNQAPGAERLQSLLSDLRAGKPDARMSLVQALQYLVYDGLDIDRLDNLDQLSSRQIALYDAVDRLTHNQVTDPVKHVRDELRRAKVEYKREESRNILPKSSTQSTRLKNGRDPHPILKRNDDPIDNQGREDIGPMMIDLIDDYATNELEADVLQMLVEGYPSRTIAASLGITKYRVETIVSTFRQRASDRREAI